MSARRTRRMRRSFKEFERVTEYRHEWYGGQDLERAISNVEAAQKGYALPRIMYDIDTKKWYHFGNIEKRVFANFVISNVQESKMSIVATSFRQEPLLGRIVAKIRLDSNGIIEGVKYRECNRIVVLSERLTSVSLSQFTKSIYILRLGIDIPMYEVAVNIDRNAFKDTSLIQVDMKLLTERMMQQAQEELSEKDITLTSLSGGEQDVTIARSSAFHQVNSVKSAYEQIIKKGNVTLVVERKDAIVANGKLIGFSVPLNKHVWYDEENTTMITDLKYRDIVRVRLNNNFEPVINSVKLLELNEENLAEIALESVSFYKN